jgi:hypothetical protein
MKRLRGHRRDRRAGTQAVPVECGQPAPGRGGAEVRSGGSAKFIARVSAVLIEDKANGPAIIQRLKVNLQE